MPAPDSFSRLQLYTVLHSIPDGVTLANADGRIVFSNDAADRILGVGAATEASPDDWADHYGVFLPDGVTPFPTDRYPLVRALDGERTQDVEMLIRNASIPDGAVIAVSGQQLRDTDGSPVGAAVVFRDITELRRIERLRDELAAFLVHDLKGPIATILGASDLLSLSLSDEVALDDVATIRRAARKVDRMVLDLLDLQVAADGELELDLTDVDLPDLLEEVRTATADRMRERPSSSVSVDAHDFRVRVDHELLFRVVMNLVDNCLKYGPRDGAIRIGTRPSPDGSVLITVEDEGPGVPEDLRERIFDKYAKAERQKDMRSKASRGLGLRFCKVIVEAHGGLIWVEDAEPRGARFCVQLPTA